MATRFKNSIERYRRWRTKSNENNKKKTLQKNKDILTSLNAKLPLADSEDQRKRLEREINIQKKIIEGSEFRLFVSSSKRENFNLDKSKSREISAQYPVSSVPSSAEGEELIKLQTKSKLEEEARDRAFEIYNRAAKLRDDALASIKKAAKQYVSHAVASVTGKRYFFKLTDSGKTFGLWNVNKNQQLLLAEKQKRIAENSKVDYEAIQSLMKQSKISPLAEAEKLNQSINVLQSAIAIRNKIEAKLNKIQKKLTKAIKKNKSADEQDQLKNHLNDLKQDREVANAIIKNSAKTPEGMQILLEQMQTLNEVRAARDEIRKEYHAVMKKLNKNTADIEEKFIEDFNSSHSNLPEKERDSKLKKEVIDFRSSFETHLAQLDQGSQVALNNLIGKSEKYLKQIRLLRQAQAAKADYLLIRDMMESVKEDSDPRCVEKLKEKIETFNAIRAMRDELRKKLEKSEGAYSKSTRSFKEKVSELTTQTRKSETLRDIEAASVFYALDDYNISQKMIASLQTEKPLTQESLNKVQTSMETLQRAREIRDSILINMQGVCRKQDKYLYNLSPEKSEKLAVNLKSLSETEKSINETTDLFARQELLVQRAEYIENNFSINDYKAIRRQRQMEADKLDLEIIGGMIKEAGDNYKDKPEKLETLEKRLQAFNALRDMRNRIKNKLDESEHALILKKKPRISDKSPFNIIKRNKSVSEKNEERRRVQDLHGDYAFTQRMLNKLKPPAEVSEEQLTLMQKQMEELEICRRYRDLLRNEIKKCDSGVRLGSKNEQVKYGMESYERYSAILDQPVNGKEDNLVMDRQRIIRGQSIESLKTFQSKRRSEDAQFDHLVIGHLIREAEQDLENNKPEKLNALRETIKAYQNLREIRDEMITKLEISERNLQETYAKNSHLINHEAYKVLDLQHDVNVTRALMAKLNPPAEVTKEKIEEIEKIMKKLQEVRRFRDEITAELRVCDEAMKSEVGKSVENFASEVDYTDISDIFKQEDFDQRLKDRASNIQSFSNKSYQFKKIERQGQDLKDDHAVTQNLIRLAEDELFKTPPDYEKLNKLEEVLKGLKEIRQTRDQIRREIEAAEAQIRKQGRIKQNGVTEYEIHMADIKQSHVLKLDALQGDYEFSKKMLDKLKPPAEVSIEKINEIKERMEMIGNLRKSRDALLNELESTEKKMTALETVFSAPDVKRTLILQASLMSINSQPDPEKSTYARRDLLKQLSSKDLKYYQHSRKIADLKSDFKLSNELIREAEQYLLQEPPNTNKVKEIQAILKTLAKIREERNKIREALELAEKELHKASYGDHHALRVEDLNHDYQFTQKLMMNIKRPISEFDIKVIQKRIKQYNQLREMRDNVLANLKIHEDKMHQHKNNERLLQKHSRRAEDAKADHAVIRALIREAEGDPDKIEEIRNAIKAYQAVMKIRDTVRIELEKAEKQNASVLNSEAESLFYASKVQDLRNDHATIREMMANTPKTKAELEKLKENIQAFKELKEKRDNLATAWLDNMNRWTFHMGKHDREYHKMLTENSKEDYAAAQAIVKSVDPKTKEGFEAAKEKLEALAKIQKERDKKLGEIRDTKKEIDQNKKDLEKAKKKVKEYKADVDSLKASEPDKNNKTAHWIWRQRLARKLKQLRNAEKKVAYCEDKIPQLEQKLELLEKDHTNLKNLIKSYVGNPSMSANAMEEGYNNYKAKSNERHTALSQLQASHDKNFVNGRSIKNGEDDKKDASLSKEFHQYKLDKKLAKKGSLEKLILDLLVNADKNKSAIKKHQTQLAKVNKSIAWRTAVIKKLDKKIEDAEYQVSSAKASLELNAEPHKAKIKAYQKTREEGDIPPVPGVTLIPDTVSPMNAATELRSNKSLESQKKPPVNMKVSRPAKLKPLPAAAKKGEGAASEEGMEMTTYSATNATPATMQAPTEAVNPVIEPQVAATAAPIPVAPIITEPEKPKPPAAETVIEIEMQPVTPREPIKPTVADKPAMPAPAVAEKSTIPAPAPARAAVTSPSPAVAQNVPTAELQNTPEQKLKEERRRKLQSNLDKANEHVRFIDSMREAYGPMDAMMREMGIERDVDSVRERNEARQNAVRERAKIQQELDKLTTSEEMEMQPIPKARVEPAVAKPTKQTQIPKPPSSVNKSLRITISDPNASLAARFQNVAQNSHNLQRSGSAVSANTTPTQLPGVNKGRPLVMQAPAKLQPSGEFAAQRNRAAEERRVNAQRAQEIELSDRRTATAGPGPGGPQ